MELRRIGRHVTTSVVAGATGSLGRCLVRELRLRGHRITAIARDAKRLRELVPEADDRLTIDLLRPDGEVEAACARADLVFSCVGASVQPGLGDGWRGYTSVDTAANRNLIRAARRRGVSGLVYVSVAAHEQLRDTAYVAAHERVVRELRESGLDYRIVRPTGFFAALSEFVRLARRGTVPLIGDGSARTNPVHEADVAIACAGAFDDVSAEVAIGGPEIVTRREIAEHAFAAVGKPQRFLNVPVAVVSATARAARPFHPRMSELLEFVAAVSTRDVIAPATGERTLPEYFRERARAST